ncbi:MAG TPA: 16S rRNA (cytosine(1402)-N(4))-methyltransferase, partial [Gammaproteobacteria bacterium]|nr:16S rRNA (cytosine(1402)-N(4))-methyltransferase [Gammaproteobacteria bacterium]
RVVVISFHSLEDRMVKQFFRRNSGGQQELPPEIPIRGQPQQGVLQTVGKRQRATAEEIDLNPRSRSAVLRVAERTTSNIDKRFQP